MAITDTDLIAVANATDQSIIVEIYDEDQAPSASGFDPADALKRYSTTGGLTFAGETYTQMIRSMGTSRRTTTNDANTFTVTLDNLTREVSQFEFATGFEGLIIVQRLISRTLSTTIAKSIILFTGRCDKPTSGTREAVTITAKGILHAIKAELPRRKFTATDAEGRTPDNVEFEGFPYMPQTDAGTTTYTTRTKRGGLLGLLGFKKTVTRTLQYSSFSDLDAEKYLPVAFGRVQVAGTHLAYADTGTTIAMTTAFLEGAIEDFINYRTDDVRFPITGTVHKRFGYPYGTGPTPYEQYPHPTTTWIGNGIYARTAMFFSQSGTSLIGEVDAAPAVIIVALGTRVPVPLAGDWVTVDSWHADAAWSDNATAIVRYLMTSEDYYRLSDDWVDYDAAIESYDYNNEFIFDSSYSDIIFVPGTASFSGGSSEKGRFLMSTGLVTADYFKYLDGSKTASEAMLKTAVASEYTGDIPSSIVIPGDPIDPPTNFPGGTAHLSYYLRRRYTCNIVFTEQLALSDAIDVIGTSSRLYITQGPTGKIKIKNKKPVDWGLATAAVSGTSISLDDVSAWVGDLHGFALVDPNTTNSELRAVTAAVYPTSQNSVTLAKTDSGGTTMTVSGATLSGCDGASTPATGTVTVTAVNSGDVGTVTLDGTAFTFRPLAADTTATVAGFIYATINGHPRLSRKFRASWTPGTAIVTITAKFGDLTVAALTQTHVAPIANPSAAPTLTAPTATGSLVLGVYFVGYTYVNARGQSLMSPVSTITISGSNRRISVAAVTPPSGATSINWFCTPTVNSYKLRYYKNNDGSAHTIDLADLPLLTAAIQPDLNRTGCEVIRVEAAFSDRAETRAARTSSNVLRASYRWKLGNREKTVNRIDLKYRDSTQDFRLVDLRLRDDISIAKIKKVNNKEVNGQAIDNHHQAYRIAAGMLAEYIDADFFYEWDSDKSAVLLEEGDVVAITDDGAEVYNLPVRIESIEYNDDGGHLKCNFVARLYATTLYDDSVAERQIPIIVETDQGVNYTV